MNNQSQKFGGIILDGNIVWHDKNARDIWISSLDGREVEVTIAKITDKRTHAQNNSLHLFFKRVADAMEAGGLDAREALSKFTVDIPMSATLVKEGIWKPIQVAVLGKSSTTDLDKQEDIDKVFEVFNRFLAKCKIESVKFPSIETQFNEINEK